MQRALDDATLGARFGLNVEPFDQTQGKSVPAKLADSHSKLYATRAKRIRPGTDDKVLTAWNGLMLAAIAEATRVLAKVSPQAITYANMATRNAEFLLSNLQPNGNLRRSWRDGKTTNEVFLEDYAALILGLLELHQTDFNPKWFNAAQELTDEMIEKFSDPQADSLTPQMTASNY